MLNTAISATANTPLRRASTHASTTTTASSRITPSIHTVGTRRSTDSRIPEEVLRDGDEIGPGLSILGQPISVVHARTDNLPTLRVIRKLGTGSYAVVYLVQEMLPIADSSSCDSYSDNFLDIREAESPRVGGKYYALKCLAKHAQEQDAQLLEATIHQSLPVHPNVVTLWTTLETASFLLLVLDYVPGEDLFYFLEQARDHVDSSSNSNGSPLTPTLLASLHPEQILSHRRLRLIASMFSQMCDALAHCHRNGVYHRDIKPENFMVTDGWVTNERTGERERRVQVKLTDFGLATRDAESGDMDCGSAPYMSYECHNNITPTYATGPADVWSLGIVLINMLYHANPWLSTATGHCQSFECFLQDPRCFFMEKFPGMTPAVAEFFSRRVFCLLESPSTPAIPLPGHSQLGFVGQRITAEEFGVWARDLPLHLGPAARRTPALAFPPLQLQMPPPRAPSPSTTNGTRRMSPSISQPGTRTPSPSFRARPPMPSSPQPAPYPEVHRSETVGTADLESDEEGDASRARTNSSSKRRKRAPRGKSQSTSTPVSEGTEAALYKASILAEKSQAVAREASAMNVGRTPPTPHATLAPVFIPPPAPSGVPTLPSNIATKRSIPELRKKKSTGWGGIFKRDSGSDQEVPGLDEISPIERVAPAPIPNTTTGPKYTQQTATVKQVSNVIMGLSPANPPVRSDLDDASWSVNGSARSSSLSARGRRKERNHGDRGSSHRDVSPGSLISVSTSSTGLSWNRNRNKSAPGEGNNDDRRARSKSPTQSALSHFNILLPNNTSSAAPAPPVPTVPNSLRGASVQVQEIPLSPPESPYAPSSYAPSSHRSYAPSIASVSTATTSSAFSAFSGKNKRTSAGSRYSGSGASVRSVSTAATSMSGGSWRNPGQMPPLPRTNIKDMDGVPTGLMDLPRQARHKPDNYVWREGGPTKKNKNGGRSAPASPLPGSSFGLESIAEKPKKSSMKPPRTAPERGIEALHSVGVIGDQRGPAYTSGDMSAFGQNPKSFSAARGMPMGLYIDAESANNYASGAMDAMPVAAAPVKPTKTPTKSKFWGAFRKERA